MIEVARVRIGIGFARRAAEARRAPDRWLIKALPGPIFPEQIGTHKGLVVEAGADEHREKVIEFADVELKRRPAVLACRGKAAVKLDLRRAQVRREAAGAAGEPDKRVRLLGPYAQDSARPMIFVRAPDKADAVGEKR